MGMVMYLRSASIHDMRELRDHPERVSDFVFGEEDGEQDGLIDFDKAWHALHFMLTGDVYGGASPLGIIAGDAEDVGVEGAPSDGFWILSPERMAAFHLALSALDDAMLMSRYDPPAMVAADIYLAGVFSDEGEDALEDVMQGVPALRQFARRCYEAGDGAVRVLG